MLQRKLKEARDTMRDTLQILKGKKYPNIPFLYTLKTSEKQKVF